MKLHLPFRRHDRTVHIRVDTGRCEACGLCVDACPLSVLRVAGFQFHRHVHVSRAGECEGCLACVDVCPHGAIQARAQNEARPGERERAAART